MHIETYTDAEVRILLKHHIKANGKQTDFAKEMEVSDAFVSAVLTGKKPVTEAMAARIGLRKAWVSEG
jgi:plasmid maintenance system antidote protein VapI